MPTEREELRLTVTLVDNVSAGLNKIKGEFRDLTEGSGKGHAEKFKKENAEAVAVLKRMGGEAGEVYKAFGMMRLGALGAAGGVALLGFEIAKQIKEWGELADKIRGTNQVGRLFGIKPEDLRNIQEQLEAFGVSAESSMGAITKFMDRMGEMQRNPAMRADILRGVIRDPGAEREMERRLAQINEATSAIEKLNLVRQLGEDIEKNALKRGETPERAAGERRMLEERLGYSPQLRMAGQLKDLTEEQRKAEEARTKNMENYANLLGQIHREWDEIGKLLNESAFKPDGFVVQGALKLKDAIVQIKETLEFIRDHGLGTYLNPFSKESMDRQKHDFEESMKKINEAEDAGKPPEERARLEALRQQAIEEADRKQRTRTGAAGAAATARSHAASAQAPHGAAVFQRRRRHRHHRGLARVVQYRGPARRGRRQRSQKIHAGEHRRTKTAKRLPDRAGDRWRRQLWFPKRWRWRQRRACVAGWWCPWCHQYPWHTLNGTGARAAWDGRPNVN